MMDAVTYICREQASCSKPFSITENMESPKQHLKKLYLKPIINKKLFSF